MSVRKVTYHEITCDYEGCGFTLWDATGQWNAFAEREAAIDAWQDDGCVFVEETGQTFCYKHLPWIEEGEEAGNDEHTRATTDS